MDALMDDENFPEEPRLSLTFSHDIKFDSIHIAAESLHQDTEIGADNDYKVNSQNGLESGLLTLTEKVDTLALNKLVDHPSISNEDLRLLKRYKAALNSDGSRIVTYKPAKHGFGRVYADKGLSLQFFPKSIRHTLAKSIYHDIDIANAHPCILSQLCSKNNWPSPKLQDYVNNREFYLQSVMDRCIVTRNQAKELFLRLSYGGTFVKWMHAR
jgi:hypothetical protein